MFASLDGTSQPTLLPGSSSSKSVKMTTPVEVSKPCKFLKARNSYCITSLFSKLVASAASLDGTSQPTLLPGSCSSKSVKMTTPVEVSKPCKFSRHVIAIVLHHCFPNL